ncbi:MAG TPA: hypothetical protein VJR58_33340, partial [Vineibacter sp.]|nr:hypothetical protein [Vineibacter sp.]
MSLAANSYEPRPTGERSTNAKRSSGEGALKPHVVLDEKYLVRAAAPSPGAGAPTSPRWGEVKMC